MATNRARGTSGGDAVADATSQAQSTTAEPSQAEGNKPEDKVREGSPDGAGADAEVQFFDGTITKIDRDGNEVMSDHLEPGETLRRATTDRYASTKHEQRAEANTGE